jgi:putative transposase
MLFGEVIDGVVRPNEMGTIVQQTWDELPTHYHGIELDAFIVMPNHVHGIIILADQSERRHTIPEIVRGFKTFSARRVNERVRIGVHVGGGFKPALGPQTRTVRWQRGYYEYVIRNEKALNRIRAYIANNPARWTDDPENISRAVSAEAGRV